MRDIHCHILPCIDDGARSLDESIQMLECAKAVGITDIVCTPHARDPYFDYESMWEAFRLLEKHSNGMSLQMGFEVHHRMLQYLGDAWIDYLAFDGTNEFLYELSSSFGWPALNEYARQIYEIQRRGYTVIIAHPERYPNIQKDTELAYELVDMGCLLQASSDFMTGGRFGKEKRPAKKLFSDNLYTYIGSDAHRTDHYRYYEKAVKDYGHLLA